MVEFLNRQMETVEVLAVDMRRFTGGDAATLVPRVIGRAARAGRAARSAPAKGLDEWLVAAMPEGAVREAARTLLERALAAGGKIDRTQGGAREGLRIRAPCALGPSSVIVAWFYPPLGVTGDFLRDFSFGSTSYPRPLVRAFPAEVLAALEDYLGEFEADPFELGDVTSGDPPRQVGWAVGPEDAAANVELLAARVEAIIRRLAAL